MNDMKESLFEALKQLLIDSLALPARTKKEETKTETPKTEVLFDNLDALNNHAFRVLNLDEQQRLSFDGFKGLLDFETLGLLNIRQREALLDKVISHSNSTISPHELKWLVMDILSHNLDLKDWMFLDYVLFPTTDLCH